MSATTYENIDVETFKKIKSENPNAIILDVRTDREFKEGYIKDAIQIDYLAPMFKSKIEQLDRDKHYLIYCRSGKRSLGACEVMQQAGFEHLYNLIGGYLNWK